MYIWGLFLDAISLFPDPVIAQKVYWYIQQGANYVQNLGVHVEFALNESSAIYIIDHEVVLNCLQNLPRLGSAIFIGFLLSFSEKLKT